MLKVAVVEDLEAYRTALVNLINWTAGYSCTGYATAEEAMEVLPVLQPHIGLVDISLPGKTGIELVAYLKHYCPSIRCVMCTAYDEDEKVFNALRAGAYGYILKSTSPAGILHAIDELNNGGSPMSADVARKVIAYFQKPLQAPEIATLTSREVEILELLSQGLLYKEIAAQLTIRMDTVKRHCFNIYAKLHVNNRTEAINKYHLR